MSTSDQTPAPKAKRGNREFARAGGLVVIAVLMTLFAVLNLEEDKVDWIFGTGHAPLIVVIVVSVLVGVLFTYAAGRRPGRRR